MLICKPIITVFFTKNITINWLFRLSTKLAPDEARTFFNGEEVRISGLKGEGRGDLERGAIRGCGVPPWKIRGASRAPSPLILISKNRLFLRKKSCYQIPRVEKFCQGPPWGWEIFVKNSTPPPLENIVSRF